MVLSWYIMKSNLTLSRFVSEESALTHFFPRDYRDVDWLVVAEVFLSRESRRRFFLPAPRGSIVAKVLIKSGRPISRSRINFPWKREEKAKWQPFPAGNSRFFNGGAKVPAGGSDLSQWIASFLLPKLCRAEVPTAQNTTANSTKSRDSATSRSFNTLGVLFYFQSVFNYF